MASNRWYNARIFQIWSAQAGYEELAGGLKPIGNGDLFWMNNSLHPAVFVICCRFLAKVHPKTEIPVIGTVLSGSLAAFLALILDLEALVEMMSIGTLLAYTIVALCVLLLRYQPGSIGIVKGGERIFSTNDESLENEEEMAEEGTRLTGALENNGPTLQTAQRAAIAIYCSLTLFFFLSVFLIWGTDALSKGQSWAIILAIILGVLVIACIVLLIRQPQNKTPLPFMVPFVPAIPLFSVFINVFLILKLSHLTWIRFGVWMAIGKYQSKVKTKSDINTGPIHTYPFLLENGEFFSPLWPTIHRYPVKTATENACENTGLSFSSCRTNS